ncbi:unnamed protein product [Cylicocyclus nassatus]|uniref:Peptidase A1 domain-containing protein n=1 Tax=Cylicocyclus nassatus TaxID=53992 RepID=A0AA36M900_CYLNA|nr:unnamed protein product [Cylicocyclus nassatus]
MMPDLVPIIEGPRIDVEKIANTVKAKYKNGVYEIRCDANLPSFEFLVEKTKYAITSDKLIVKQYYVIFDYTEKRLGFASAKDANKTTVRPATKTTFRPTTRRKKLAPIVCNSEILILMLILLNPIQTMSALYITIILIAAVALMQVAPTLHDLQGDYGISLNNFNFKGRNSIASESFGNSTTNSSTLGQTMSALYITMILIATVELIQVAPALHDLQGGHGISHNNFNLKERNSFASERFGNSTTNSSTLGPVPRNVTSTLRLGWRNVTFTSAFPKYVTSTPVI